MVLLIPLEIARQHARMAESAMITGERAKALRAIERAWDVAEDEKVEIVTLDSGVSAVASIKVANILECNGVITVGDLVTLTAEKIARFNHMGTKSIGLIQESLERYGLSLEKSSVDRG